MTNIFFCREQFLFRDARIDARQNFTIMTLKKSGLDTQSFLWISSPRYVSDTVAQKVKEYETDLNDIG